jgi:hypothetical protein
MNTTRGPRYSKEEFRKRGEAIFEKKVCTRLKGRNPRDFVAIDIESEEYEVDKSEMAACGRLRDRIPDAQIWLRRVGSPYARRFGGRLWKSAK